MLHEFTIIYITLTLYFIHPKHFTKAISKFVPYISDGTAFVLLLIPPPVWRAGTETAHTWIFLVDKNFWPVPLPPTPLLYTSLFFLWGVQVTLILFPSYFQVLLIFPLCCCCFSLFLADSTDLQVEGILPLTPSLLLCLRPRWEQGVMDIRDD